MNDKRDGQGACYLKNGACRAKKRPGARPAMPWRGPFACTSLSRAARDA